MKEVAKTVWGRFGQRRSRRDEAVERAVAALGNVRERFGRLRTKGEQRAYGNTVGLGIGILILIIVISLSFWLLRRRARETASTTPSPEGEEVVVPPGPPSTEEVPPGEGTTVR